jgi:hypothetical protein
MCPSDNKLGSPQRTNGAPRSLRTSGLDVCFELRRSIFQITLRKMAVLIPQFLSFFFLQFIICIVLSILT